MAYSFALIDSEGEIKNLISPGYDEQFVDGQSYGSDNFIAKRVSTLTVDDMDIKWYDSVEDTWKDRDPRPGVYSSWASGSWSFNSLVFWEVIRGQRDDKLSMTDWTQMPDAPLTEEKKLEWRVYRQALRDLPANQSSVIEEANISWPTEPS